MSTGVGHEHAHDASTTGAPGRRWVAPAAVGAAVAAGTLAVAAMSPSDGGTPICLSRSLLGVDCPLCGGLRIEDLLAAGDLLAAADHNVLLAVLLPLLAIGWAVWMVRSLLDRPTRVPRLPSWSLVTAGIVMVVFGVARNLGDDGVLGWLAATAN